MMSVVMRLAALSAIMLSLATCTTEPGGPSKLQLEVTSDAPASGGSLQSLRVLFVGADGTRYPAQPGAEVVNFTLGDLDPVASPVRIEIGFDGTTFADPNVTIQVTGRIGDTVATIYEGEVVLTAKKVEKVHLMAIGSACDADADGFLDCNVEGCCPSGTSLSDCEPDDALSSPWGTEDVCEPCTDTADNDCSGGDAPCIDADGDGFNDNCDDCDPSDVNSYPGAPELCDDKDNDCDGSTDNGIVWIDDYDNLPQAPQPVALGDPCGVGACEGGTVICGDGGLPTCSTIGERSAETCNGEDSDCNGLVDDGCGDVDGDGYGAAPDGPDCNDYDSGVYPDAPEPCCPSALNTPGSNAIAKCDKNCDGVLEFCANEDTDSDGFNPDSDCNNDDPTIYPGAPEKCGDGIDQDCFGGDQACSEVTDADGDGYGSEVDCDDNDAEKAPNLPEVCDGKDNDCNGPIDDGNPDTNDGEACGSDIGECALGTTVCVNSVSVKGEVQCVGDVRPIDEMCDGLDNDCDESTDEDFTWTDDGGVALAIDDPCDGTGFCGLGTVECACPVGSPGCAPEARLATCSSNANGSEPEDMVEVCDGLDNDCDGQINEDLTSFEDSTCLKKGVCVAAGAVVAAKCNEDTTGTWTCGYEGVPDYEAGTEVSCDGKDNNCDGFTDEHRNVGQGCDGADADLCANGTLVCDADPADPAICDESDVNKPEICDGLDNDCDGDTDEDFVLLGTPCDTDDSDLCDNGLYECAPDGSGEVCLTETVTNIVDICDGLDNDCDGSTDEDYPTKGDACDSNDTDKCKNGTLTCRSDGSGVECVNETVTNIAETCNGFDDDCDGEVDEDAKANGLGLPCDSTADTDFCPEGVTVCAASESNVSFDCDEEAEDDIEVCDNTIDNDCDGATDEGLGKGDSCDGDDLDKCKNGSFVCGPNPTGPLVCNEPGGTGIVEKCDQAGTADEDCDGQINEDWPEKGQPCDGSDSDQCMNGTWTCTSDGSGVQCTNETVTDIVEQCNGIDDDCDNSTDEANELTPPPADDQDGVCAGVVKVCDGLNGWVEPNYGDQAKSYQSTETMCDSLDNDCDGVTDENCPCDYGGDSDGVCGTATISPSNGQCAKPAAHQNTETTCDSLDNDCDGVTDENCDCDYTGDSDGVCGTAKISPSNGQCAQPTGYEATEATCDGLDNDCDGSTDNGLTAPNNSDQDGVCAGSKQTCTGGGGWVDDYSGVTDYEATETSCDSLDNDCDGSTDIGCGCDYTGTSEGVCGTAVIGGAAPGSCQQPAGYDATDNEQANCDGVDNDCDGETDEGCPCDVGGDSDGECANGTINLTDDTVCDPPGTYEAGTETLCDGLDNDCDGSTDEMTSSGSDYAADDGKSKGDECGVGACTGGTFVCDSGALVCSTSSNATSDACDGEDNDCDGAFDEGCSGDLLYCSGVNVQCPLGTSCVSGSCLTVKGKGQPAVYVPGGAFTMGTGTSGTENESHEVRVSPFLIDRFEVTCALYKACVTSAQCTSTSELDTFCNPSSKNDLPAHYVTWSQAQTFCQDYASGDLCTEAQWEVAARTNIQTDGTLGTETTYPWGDSSPDCATTCHHQNISGDGCGTDTTTDVTNLSAGDSHYGARHMAGNVVEWVRDRYSSSYYPSSPLADPTGPTSGSMRVSRGGSYLQTSANQASDRRWEKTPATSEAGLGFRCCYPAP